MLQDGQPPRLTARHETVARPVVGYAHDYVSGWETGRHVHRRAQLLHATTGMMRVTTDAAVFTVPPGSGLWVPADVAHGVRMEGAVRMRALFLRADAARAGPDGIAVLAVSALLRELILAACDEGPDWDRRGRGRHLAALAMHEIAAARVLPLSLPAPSDARLCRVVAALQRNPADPRDLEGYAADAGASARTLARLFQAETGMSFGAWRRHWRMTEALALLSCGMPPTQVAARVGYDSGPAFGAAFRGTFGVTPGAVRKEGVLF
jgi:AraC-like DNA-binding protein